MATGQLVKGVILGVLGVTIVGSIDNFLRSAILSGRTQMNGLLMFISLLGGVSVFGLLGLVLGPLVTAIVIGLFEVYVRTSDIIGTARTNENTKLRNPHSPFNEHPEGNAAPR